MIVPLFIPSLPTSSVFQNQPASFTLLAWASPLLGGLFLWFFWKALNGYTVYGATDESFRKSLLSALEKSNLKYSENLNGIHLKSHDATLKASVFWMGTGQIRVKGKLPGKTLRKVMGIMGEELQKPGMGFDLKPFLFYFAFGLVFLIFTLFEVNLLHQIEKL